MTYSNEPDVGASIPDDEGRPDVGKPAAAKQEASQVAHAVKGHASDVAGSAQAGAQQVVADAKEHAVSLVGEARGQLAGLLGQAETELGGRSAEQTAKAATSLRSVSDQLHALVDGRPQDAPRATGYLRQAAGRVEAYAERLDRDGVGGVTSDVTGFARRRPGLFLVAAVAAGFAAGRLAKGAKTVAGSDDDRPERSWSAPPPAPPAVGTSTERRSPTPVGQKPLEEFDSGGRPPAGAVGEPVDSPLTGLLPPTYLSGREGDR